MEGIRIESREADRPEFLFWCNPWHSDPIPLILEAFRDREGGASLGISGINLPSVDSKLRNIYNFSTAFISTEGDLCAITDYC